MLRPKVVVADEPVSALDVSIQAQVLNLLMDLQEEFGLAYLFISHGLSVVEHIADHLVVMYLGQPVEHGTKAAIFRHPRHPYTKALLASTPFVDPAKRAERVVLKGELPSPLAPPPGCAFHRRCPYATDLCHSVRRSCARWMGAWWPAIMRSRWGENRTDTIVAQLPFSLAAFESNPKGRWGVKRSGLRRSGRGRALAGGDSSGMATKYIGLAPPLPHSPRTVFGYRISPKGCTSLQHCHRISNSVTEFQFRDQPGVSAARSVDGRGARTVLSGRRVMIWPSASDYASDRRRTLHRLSLWIASTGVTRQLSLRRAHQPKSSHGAE